MKKMILLLILSFSTLLMNAGINGNAPLLERKPVSLSSTSNFRNLSLKSYLMARKEFKKTSTDRIAPKFSMSLLEGKGIHLFSTSEMGPIPSMKIGAKFTASIKITL